MRFRYLTPFLWLAPGLALLVVWRTVTGFLGLAWWCKLLWLPVLLAGIVQCGLSLQSLRRAEGVSVLAITHREVIKLQPLALLALLTATLTSTALLLLFMYPEQPKSALGWTAAVLTWPVLWFAWSWLRTALAKRGASGRGA